MTALALLAVVLPLVQGERAGSSPLPAQPTSVVDLSTLRPGHKVRLWTRAAELAGSRGTITAVDHEGFACILPDRPKAESIHFADLTRLDVRRDRRHVKLAAAIGFLVGVAAALAIDDFVVKGSDWEDRTKAAAISGGLGAGIGALTAAARWPARWQSVTLEPVPVSSPEAPSPTLKPR